MKIIHKNYFIFSLILNLLVVYTSYAQSEADLLQINHSAKDAFVSPEALDQLMIRLRPFENSTVAGQDSILLDTYKTIALRYSANNHYKQAYQVFKKYLSYKESRYIVNKNNIITEAQHSVDNRNKTNEEEILKRRDQVQQLQIDNDLLISRRSNFKRYFTFIIITLSVLFGVMLVNSGFKLFSIRNRWIQNKARMKNLHRIATLGMLAEGIRENTLKKFQYLKSVASDTIRFLQDKKLVNSDTISKEKELQSSVKSLEDAYKI